jgi:hypothetical protein
MQAHEISVDDKKLLQVKYDAGASPTHQGALPKTSKPVQKATNSWTRLAETF